MLVEVNTHEVVHDSARLLTQLQDSEEHLALSERVRNMLVKLNTYNFLKTEFRAVIDDTMYVGYYLNDKGRSIYENFTLIIQYRYNEHHMAFH